LRTALKLIFLLSGARLGIFVHCGILLVKRSTAGLDDWIGEPQSELSDVGGLGDTERDPSQRVFRSVAVGVEAFDSLTRRLRLAGDILRRLSSPSGVSWRKDG
jgi:hypothetical protein